MFFKIGVLKNFAIFKGKHVWWIYLKENRTQVVFCEYCKIFKNTYFEEHPRTADFVPINIELVIKYWASVGLFLIKNITWNGFY